MLEYGLVFSSVSSVLACFSRMGCAAIPSITHVPAKGVSLCVLTFDLGCHERHETNYLLSYRHLYQPNDNMGVRDLLNLPKNHRRRRSKTRSESASEPVQGPSEVDATVPNFTESAPDHGIDSPTSHTSTHQGSGSAGMQAPLSW